MTIEQLRRAVKVDEFKPFTLSLADGRRFFVPHPEFVWIPPEAARTIHVAGKGEDFSVVDLLLVTSLDFGNGATGRERRKSRRAE
jgi:hypothetical protein